MRNCIPKAKSKQASSRAPRKRGQDRIPRSIGTELIYPIRRTASQWFGVNSYTGFTNNIDSANYGNGLGIAFSLNNILLNGTSSGTFSTSVPNASEFVNLFDRFRIREVEITIVPSASVALSQSVAIGAYQTTVLPIVQWAHDYDDYSPPTSSNDLCQRNDVKFLRFDDITKLKCKPRLSSVVGIVGGVSTAGVAQSREEWCSTSSNGQDTIWNGIKLYSEPLATSPGVMVQNFYMYTTITFEFKTPR